MNRCALYDVLDTMPESELKRERAMTMLYIACRGDDGDLAEGVLRHYPLAVNQPRSGATSYSPLQTAAKHHAYRVMSVLLSYGADASAGATDGNSPAELLLDHTLIPAKTLHCIALLADYDRDLILNKRERLLSLIGETKEQRSEHGCLPSKRECDKYREESRLCRKNILSMLVLRYGLSPPNNNDVIECPKKRARHFVEVASASARRALAKARLSVSPNKGFVSLPNIAEEGDQHERLSFRGGRLSLSTGMTPLPEINQDGDQDNGKSFKERMEAM